MLDYVTSCYDKEIDYYSKGGDDIDWCLINPDTEDEESDLPLDGPKREMLLAD